ncbi:hypothetical protein A9Q99_00585 [Gammaproteobacteria bacterium 45_16_T64]|nr:hypothetical protein A9Q99_00585 [Gammaproteobacteria bacterium 45_16_T64]
MSMAPRIEAHLDRVGVNYSILSHPHSQTSLQSARVARVPASQLAKAVITHDGDNYRLCVMPSTHRLVMSLLNEHMGGDFRLVEEKELERLFDDCEKGAVPALGQVYGMPVVWDHSLGGMDEIYFESGDHETLIHIDQGAFMELMGLQEHSVISCLPDGSKPRKGLVH